MIPPISETRLKLDRLSLRTRKAFGPVATASTAIAR